MTTESGETYGRYCLPVQQEPPLTTYTSYRVAAAHMLLADFVCFVANLDVLHVSAAVRHLLEVWLFVTFMGLLGTMIWISSARKRARATPR